MDQVALLEGILSKAAHHKGKVAGRALSRFPSSPASPVPDVDLICTPEVPLLAIRIEKKHTMKKPSTSEDMRQLVHTPWETDLVEVSYLVHLPPFLP